MIYFANASSVGVRAEMMRNARLGQIVTPAERRRPIGALWCADNSVFGGKYPGNQQYVRWLARQPHGGRCLFAVAPDVVGDHEATLHRSLPMLETLRAVTGSVAFVAQNGATPSWVPWPLFDVLFLGGTTEWKLGADARTMVAAARRQGKWVHMGRVNSAKRFAYAAAVGCHSADGTFLARGPDANLPRVLSWFAQTPMWRLRPAGTLRQQDAEHDQEDQPADPYADPEGVSGAGVGGKEGCDDIAPLARATACEAGMMPRITT